MVRKKRAVYSEEGFMRGKISEIREKVLEHQGEPVLVHRDFVMELQKWCFGGSKTESYFEGGRISGPLKRNNGSSLDGLISFAYTGGRDSYFIPASAGIPVERKLQSHYGLGFSKNDLKKSKAGLLLIGGSGFPEKFSYLHESPPILDEIGVYVGEDEIKKFGVSSGTNVRGFLELIKDSSGIEKAVKDLTSEKRKELLESIVETMASFSGTKKHLVAIKPSVMKLYFERAFEQSGGGDIYSSNEGLYERYKELRDDALREIESVRESLAEEEMKRLPKTLKVNGTSIGIPQN